MDVFVDGAHALHRSPVAMSPYLRGPLILGNSADGSFPWTGDIFGLAIYSRALSTSEQAEHARNWSMAAPANVAASPDLTALFIFNERPERTVIHDRTGSNNDISIPSRFHPVRRVLLRRYSVHALNWPDIIVNVIGFIPLGVVLFAYFQVSPRSRHQSALLALVVSVGTSVSIEVLQLYLPSRDPSLIDVTTNAFGAAVGIVCSYVILRLYRVSTMPAA
jgi:hypothetical protein